MSAGNRLSLLGYYVFNHSSSDTRGVDYFASNPWNPMEDYGRAAFDIRNRIAIGGHGGFAAPTEAQLDAHCQLRPALQHPAATGCVRAPAFAMRGHRRLHRPRRRRTW